MRDRSRPASAPPLIGRDPRNPDHVRHAFDTVTSVAAGRYITEATVRDLHRANIPVPADFVVRKKVPRGHVLLAAFFFLEEGLQLPDNTITKCDGCGAALQRRPHASTAATLCCFCCVDRLVAENQLKAKKSKKAASRR